MRAATSASVANASASPHSSDPKIHNHRPHDSKHFCRRVQLSPSPIDYVYDGLNVALAYNGSTSVSSLLGLDLDELYLENLGGVQSSLLKDALGSTVALTGTTQTVTDTYSYEPYGGATHTFGTSINGYLFAGQAYDFTNLYFMRNRYYLPALGRFISRDPAGLRGGVNPYIYAGDNPISLKDPTKMDWGFGGDPPGDGDGADGGDGDGYDDAGGGDDGFGIDGGDDPGAPDPGSEGGDNGSSPGDTSGIPNLGGPSDYANQGCCTVENGQGYYGRGYGYGPEEAGAGYTVGGPGVGGGPIHGPRMAPAGGPIGPSPTPVPDCGQQCWNDYGAILLKACGEVGVAGGAGSCALACTPTLLGGPGAYGGCFGTCGTYVGIGISACAGAATIRYFQCKSACGGR